ncbi:hypothetical protein [Pseudomonas gingeri]|uniref:hypothetical protein n=1 Tax=Pseudomonas gingeri TaxID=117681 RepID=UPI0015A1EAF3|nr:hypothetical protein [Pseudomonas gingeri]NWA03756.1 hypothetical protein [Pseudomonas gingeri]NWA14615.1 hypothetical protein [Pseudomonas gingeri]NWA58743.1 hypothetical protein [Pseudomonas gingeri]NWA94491.1 hypothetical protein [Pseudomonas gingeri]NWB01147.1 hypothetical protein [Pseudomonas gingeri]
MTALLLLYLCADATRTDCKALPVERFDGADAYERCIGALPAMTASLSAKNRERHQFVCEVRGGDQARPALIHQSFRM